MRQRIVRNGDPFYVLDPTPFYVRGYRARRRDGLKHRVAPFSAVQKKLGTIVKKLLTLTLDKSSRIDSYRDDSERWGTPL
jgi:hypothetical protein